MGRAGYIDLPDGKRAPIYQIDRQKYVCQFLFTDAVAVAQDVFQFQPLRITLPDYNLVQLQDLYVYSYVNRGATDVLIPDQINLSITDENKAAFDQCAPFSGTIATTNGSVFGFKNNLYMQNIGMRFIYPPTIPGPGPQFLFAILKEAGLLIGDVPVLAARIVFEDYQINKS